MSLFSLQIFHDPDALKYVSHIALHWYADSYSPIQLLDETHELFPHIPLFGTEACTGYEDNFVKLGSWERGEEYAQNIIQVSAALVLTEIVTITVTVIEAVILTIPAVATDTVVHR